MMIQDKELSYRRFEPLYYFMGLLRGPTFSLFLFFFAFYYLMNAGGNKEGDESAMQALAESISKTGRIGFELNHPIDSDYIGDIVKGSDGLHYYKWGLGQSILEVPFYILCRLFEGEASLGARTRDHFDQGPLSQIMLLFLCPSLISAMGCVLLFRFALRFRFSPRVSLTVGLIYGLTTMVWPYSKSLMAEATINVAIMGSAYGSVSYVFKRHPMWLLMSGLSAGFAFLTKPISAIIIPILAIYVVAGARSRRSLLEFVLFFGTGFGGFLCIGLWHNVVRFGSALNFGYSTGRDSLGFGTPLYVGLWGLFASPGKTFFLYTPVSMLGIACFSRFLKRYPAEGLVFIGICTVYVVPHAMWWAWAGDWAWGPRFLLPITPYFILPIGMFLEEWYEKSFLRRVLVVSLIVFSLWIQVLGVFIHPFSYISARSNVVGKYINLNPTDFTYSWAYGENVFTNFNPIFSHIVGNWWLFKHMILVYDFSSDAPWKTLGDVPTDPPPWVKNGRTVPFWWPVSIPLQYPQLAMRLYTLAFLNFLVVLWGALRLVRLLRISASSQVWRERERNVGYSG
jgi:hypothetical protein